MVEEEEGKETRVLLLGLLLSAGRYLLIGLGAASLWCIPDPNAGRPPESESESGRPGPAPPEPSLTLAERLTWRGLQWHLARKKLPVGPDETAQPQRIDP